MDRQIDDGGGFMIGKYKILYKNGKENDIKINHDSEKKLYDNYFVFSTKHKNKDKLKIPCISGSPVYYLMYFNIFNKLKIKIEEEIRKKFEITEINTPNLIENTEEIKTLQKLFGLEQFICNNKYVLPPASDFGIFSFFKNKDLTIEKVNSNIYEFASCYRIETKQQNNVLIRPSCFHLPDMHFFLKNNIYLETRKHLLFYSKILNELNIDYNFALRISENEYNKHKEDILEIVQAINKDLIINIVPFSIRYWEAKFKFIYKDGDGNYVQLSTVQIDYKSSKIFNIKMKGENVTILHSSIGSLERLIYAYLEIND